MKFSRVLLVIFLIDVMTLSACTALVTAITPPPTATNTPLPEPTVSPIPTSTPLPTSSPTPEPNVYDMYYTQDGEYYYADPGGNYWLYSCEDLYIYVQKLRNEELQIVYYVASIRLKNPDQMSVGLADEKDPGTHRDIQEKLAAKHKAVLSFNGDFFTDRTTGVVIRNRKVWRNKPSEPILALYSDGDMKVFEGKEKTADQLLAEGVTNTFAFGPILMRDGTINAEAIAKHPLRSRNPRTGIGMVEKGHYLGIVVEGRQGEYSQGITLEEFAKLFAGYDCQLAYNLDGGQSSVIAFMGMPLNDHTKDLSGSKWNTFRRVPEILIFGTSQDVPTDRSKSDAVADPPRIVDWLNSSGVTNIPTGTN